MLLLGLATEFESWPSPEREIRSSEIFGRRSAWDNHFDAVMATATGVGSGADRGGGAQNDSEGFVSRYNKYASLSLKRQRELLPIFKHSNTGFVLR